jgi:protoporphyrinogen oxidase
VKVVVVGAGIAGLAAAWELMRAEAHFDIIVLESERRAGGVIVSEHVEGFLVEGGPDGFLASESELPALAAELGIAQSVVDQMARGTSVWSGSDLEPVEEGRAAAMLGIDLKGADVRSGFCTFARGMAQPVAALVEKLAGAIHFAQGASGLFRDAARWRIAITGGSAYDADAVVLALPAWAAGRLVETAGVRHGRSLAEVVYLPSVTVSLAYAADQIVRTLPGAGFVVGDPLAHLRACTFSSAKFPGRAPADHVLLRAFLAPLDEDPAVVAHRELAAILQIRGAPLWARVFYWNRGLPRYRHDHQARVTDVRRQLARLPPLAIAGAGYDGAGVSACIRSGREAGRAIARLMAR